MVKLLILGGTSEAAELARRLPPSINILTSWAGRTKTPPDLPGMVRIGGFCGAKGLEEFLRTSQFDAVIDATHPFAAQISANAAQACKQTGVPRMTLTRPLWEKREGDQWVMADSLEEAAEKLPELGRRPMLTIGRQRLDAFTPIHDAHFFVRLLEPPEAPLPLKNYSVLTGRPPFSLEEEQEHLRYEEIDLLITKQSGGSATYAKIEAARMAGIPVLMIKRPASPPGKTVTSIEACLDWLSRL